MSLSRNAGKIDTLYLQGDHHEPTPTYANAVPHATTSFSTYYGGPSHVSYNNQYNTTGAVQHCPAAAPSYHTPPTLPYPNITPSLYNNSLNLLPATTNFTTDCNEPDENNSNERPSLVVPNCIPSSYESFRQVYLNVNR
ncbi:hypothetical protein EB796_017515 [Bugula neritina]|uniref:Uncharacterized protein n=1 Tax=Bugula neritina TaxID=10212 RepID=A0A7J7JEY8_BUGNE|nr:hypothetical protein EB796_017515 [Bugula neritina]